MGEIPGAVETVTIAEPRRRRDGSVDTRTPTTMWALLVWAYRQQQVRYAGRAPQFDNPDWRPASQTAAVMSALANGIAGRGAGWAINGRPSAHADADMVHDLVARLATGPQWRMIRAGESGEPVVWAPELPAWRLVPVLGKNGRPRHLLCPVTRRPIACLAQQVGVPESARAMAVSRARLDYLAWCSDLADIRDALVDRDELTRWSVGMIGLPVAPWMETVIHNDGEVVAA